MAYVEVRILEQVFQMALDLTEAEIAKQSSRCSTYLRAWRTRKRDQLAVLQSITASLERQLERAQRRQQLVV